MSNYSALRITASQPLLGYMQTSYNTMRFGMGVFTAAFPVAVWISGLLYCKRMPGSLSAYYWLIETEPNTPRTVFVGGLFAVALFFYVYKGYCAREELAFKAAAVFALGVALVPKSHGNWNHPIWHAGFAIALFMCLAYVVWRRAKDTLKELEASGEVPPSGKYSVAWYRRRYRLIGTVMALSPVLAAICDLTLRDVLGDPMQGALGVLIFFVESFGIWAFSWFWFLKGSELRRATKTTRRVIESTATSQLPPA